MAVEAIVRVFRGNLLPSIPKVKWTAKYRGTKYRGQNTGGHALRTLVWLALIERRNLLSGDCLKKAQEDCTVVCRIIAASINTVKGRMKKEAG